MTLSATPADGRRSDPIRRLRVAVRLLRARHRPTAEWLASALEQHLSCGDDFAKLLGLSVADGGRSARFEFLAESRNRLLRQALAELAGSFSHLQREILSFERLPRALKLQAPSAGAPRVRQLVQRAYRYGLGLPGTEAGLRKALRRTKLSDDNTVSPGLPNDRLHDERSLK